jgi:hypothetical protein
MPGCDHGESSTSINHKSCPNTSENDPALQQALRQLWLPWPRALKPWLSSVTVSHHHTLRPTIHSSSQTTIFAGHCVSHPLASHHSISSTSFKVRQRIENSCCLACQMVLARPASSVAKQAQPASYRNSLFFPFPFSNILPNIHHPSSLR